MSNINELRKLRNPSWEGNLAWCYFGAALQIKTSSQFAEDWKSDECFYLTVIIWSRATRLAGKPVSKHKHSYSPSMKNGSNSECDMASLPRSWESPLKETLFHRNLSRRRILFYSSNSTNWTSKKLRACVLPEMTGLAPGQVGFFFREQMKEIHWMNFLWVHFMARSPWWSGGRTSGVETLTCAAGLQFVDRALTQSMTGVLNCQEKRSAARVESLESCSCQLIQTWQPTSERATTKWILQSMLVDCQPNSLSGYMKIEDRAY